MIRCAIIDDEPLARKLLVDYIEKVPYLALAGSFSSGLEALNGINHEKLDLIFLDIRMPDISGIDLLKTLSNRPQVIFTTAFAEFALEGYELDVTDYLLKPFDFARFLKAVEKARNKAIPSTGLVEQIKKHLFVKEGNSLVKVGIGDILYIKGLKDYLKIITTEKEYIILHTMKGILTELPSDQFLRIHNSYIISLEHVESITANRVKVNGELLPIGTTFKKYFFEVIDQMG